MSLQEYVPVQWVDDAAPAIDDTNLNHIENGIKAVTDETKRLAEAPTYAQETVPGVSKMWLTNGTTLNIKTS